MSRRFQKQPHNRQTRATTVADRRFMIRYPSKAGARVIRDSDMMRNGIECRLKDLSSAGLGILIGTRLDEKEQIKVELRNDVQRVFKLVRGVIRHVTPRDDGLYHVGVELFTRLTPLEVSLLKMGAHEADSDTL